MVTIRKLRQCYKAIPRGLRREEITLVDDNVLASSHLPESDTPHSVLLRTLETLYYLQLLIIIP